MTISLRPFLSHDAPALAALFRASMTELASEDYDEAQIDAWVSISDDAAQWAQKFDTTLTLLAFVGQTLAGFATLRGKDEIDMLYVAPDFVRQGVASALLVAVEKLAHARGAQTLRVDAPDNAEAFFKARGYGAQRRNTVCLAGAFIGTTTLTKPLEPQTEH
jgi:putative acetyltransferase